MALRHFSTSLSRFKSLPIKNSKSGSSHQWLSRQLTDPYVDKAKVLNYRCRSAFKLLEINNKFKILKPGQIVVDCGAAPGSWTQVAVKSVNSDLSTADEPQGKVISIDKQQIFKINGAIIVGNADFTDPQTQAKVLEKLDGRRVNVVLSDMAPNATGVRHLDYENIINLCYSVLKFAVQVSDSGGILLVKLWQCGQTKQLETDINRFYRSVKNVKPAASRADSAELFLLGRDFKGIVQQ